MKKIFSAFLIAVIFVSFAACGAESPKNESEGRVYGEFKWPQSDIAKFLPVPKSDIGYIDWEKEYGFVIYVSETSKEDYNAYVEACAANGFTKDYNKGDGFYWAENSDGYGVHLKYEDGGVMFIRIDKPEETPEQQDPDIPPEDNAGNVNSENKDDNVNEEDKKEDNGGPSSGDTSDSEFRAAMDSYEAFIDSYIAFMKKYENAEDPTDMLGEYSDFMTEYSEVMRKMSSVDRGKLSADDLICYTEVNNRILKKLAELG